MKTAYLVNTQNGGYRTIRVDDQDQPLNGFDLATDEVLSMQEPSPAPENTRWDIPSQRYLPVPPSIVADDKATAAATNKTTRALIQVIAQYTSQTEAQIEQDFKDAFKAL